MNKTLAHIGLGIVTYVPLVVYVLFTSLMTEDNVFADGLVAFLGYFATAMTMFGWIFLIPALIISIRGLVKRESMKINGTTLLICIGWIITGYWVITHFA